jgi:protein-tyrosine phosphatase
MAYLYLAVLETAAATFADVVRLAADPDNHPMVFHCTAGKDRTGVAAALMLGALGVADDDLLDDYELTATYRSRHRIETMRPTLEAAGVDVDAVRAYLSAERAVLATTLDGLRHRGDRSAATSPTSPDSNPTCGDRVRATLLGP